MRNKEMIPGVFALVHKHIIVGITSFMVFGILSAHPEENRTISGGRA